MKQTGDWGSEKSPLDPTGKQWGRNRRRPRLRRGPPCGNQATAGWRGALGSTRAAPASIRGRLAAYRGPRVLRGPPTPCMVIKGSPLGNQATRGCRRDGTQRIQRGCRRGTARGLRRPMDRFWVRHASVTHPPGGDAETSRCSRVRGAVGCFERHKSPLRPGTMPPARRASAARRAGGTVPGQRGILWRSKHPPAPPTLD